MLKHTSQRRPGLLQREQAKGLAAHYDKLAPRYGTLYEGDSRLARFYKSRQTRACEFMDESGGARVLEIGCGPGLLADLFLKKGMNYWGVDISPAMINVCREKFREIGEAHFSVGDVQELTFASSEFDAVVSLGMLEYVHDEQEAVSEMARVLKIHGTLVLSGITKWSPYNVFNRLVNRKLRHRNPACIVHEYHTDGEYRDLLRSAQFDVVDIAYFDFTPFEGLLPARVASARLKPESSGRDRLSRMGNGFLVRAEKRG